MDQNNSANSRFRRKMLMKDKQYKRQQRVTGLYVIDMHFGFHILTVISQLLGYYLLDENCTPLAQMFRQEASTSRPHHVPRTPLSTLYIAANEPTPTNSIVTSCYDTYCDNLPSKRKHPSGVTSSTPDLTHDADTPVSEVINPTSTHVIKRVSQPTHVLESIPSFAFNFHVYTADEPVNNRASTSINNGADFGRYDKYDQAETEEMIDFGNPSYICSDCGADMWYEERSDKCDNTTVNLRFSLCCSKGIVHLPYEIRPPELLINLMNGQDSRSKHYRENIRAYNSMFCFTSIGGKVQSNKSGGPPQFILGGQNYHRMGSLVPDKGVTPKFAQLYIYDTQNEISNRFIHFRSGGKESGLDRTLVEDITKMVDDNNVLVKSFRKVRDHLQQNNTSNFCLRLFRNRTKDPRTHNLPSCDEVAALIVGDFQNLDPGRDIIVRKTSGHLVQIRETHASFLALQYPLLFPFGEDQYHENIPYRESVIKEGRRKRLRVTFRDFIAFRIQERKCENGSIVNAGRLFQQFVVDGFSMIESQRLYWHRMNQATIRCDILSGLQEAVHNGENQPSAVGKRIVLPASFTGGLRYMFNNCQDAMAICKKFGYPDLFITITCNANWPEIKNFVTIRGLTASDRPDIVCRIFKAKLDHMMNAFKKEKIFGEVVAGTYTIEFQKRGLPHAHILLWLEASNSLKTGTDIDKYISAELPDHNLYPNLANVVSSFMIHGPCGKANLNSQCMKDGKCSKYFPKDYQDSTIVSDEGYPKYRRRDNGLSVVKKGITLDNRYVVPYNPQLLVRYQAHINVEYCNKGNAIKYLFKYVNKGPDRATVGISNQTENGKVLDEIKQYYECRYLAPCESVWRIFEYDIHQRWPPVIRLSFHLENEQSIMFSESNSVESVLNRSEEIDTMFLAWFEANKKFPDGRDLTYGEFPTRFVYDKSVRAWHPRQRGNSIGRLTYIPPGCGNVFYLRLLLTIQKGCTSYNDIKTVDGTIHKTFKEACIALGLLQNDKEFVDAIIEASHLASGNQMRRLFVMLLFMDSMTNPFVVWEATWKLLCDGILYDARKRLNNPGLQIMDDDLKNLCLIEFERLLSMNGKSLDNIESMPQPSNSEMQQFKNSLLAGELNYDKEEMVATHMSLMSTLTVEQRSVYDQIINSVMMDCGGFYFLHGYGGTGKTFIWKTVSAALRSQGLIVLNVASSGIASLLLPGGKTAHSMFGIPLVTTETSACNIKKRTDRCELILQSKLIIWDEAPMLNRFCAEAVDRSLKDIMRTVDDSNQYKPFGGKVVVFGGDFRQILPVVRKGCRHDIVSASINSSELWKFCKVLTLSNNMRLAAPNSNIESKEVKEFSDWMLDIGNGKQASNESGESTLHIPEDLLVTDSHNPLLCLVELTYPNLLQNMNNLKYYEERALLSPTHDSVDIVNDFVLSLIPGDEKEYLSADSTVLSDENCAVRADWFTPEFLNEMKCSGMPNHRLRLKIGVPVMLLRNIDQSNGLCNGTRLLINELCHNIIGATVITGKNIGDKIYIPRMNLISSDPSFPFKFQRRQFPIALCFAMTINKSQGQSLSQVGLYLQRPVFTHGQFYVAISRVKSRKGLKILIIDDEGNPCADTTNVVYREVFDNL
ncbi:uncharacterized protein LOC131601957 [Vicia villosa]|uniref:uncharacterized protein LOC131601957 n=1 Tax=Vicia villosa TaxID=3911 RepID=UPI00273B53E4|nr:uncharacterized protein LOC131601957 [Vicia villosa]